MMHRQRSFALTGTAAADAAALLWLVPDPSRLAGALRRPHAWVDRVGTDAALATLAGAALWLAALWLGLGLLAMLAGRVPGTVGRCAERVSRTLLPRALRALLAGSAGVGVLLAPAAALAQPAPAAAAAPAPAWPVTSPAVPAPAWPTAAAPAPDATDGPAPPTGSATVPVRPGDSLWVIAARRLGPAATPERVAAEWPRWYRANRAAVGPDPSLIHPGQVLRAPAHDAEEARR